MPGKGVGVLGPPAPRWLLRTWLDPKRESEEEGLFPSVREKRHRSSLQGSLVLGCFLQEEALVFDAIPLSPPGHVEENAQPWGVSKLRKQSSPAWGRRPSPGEPPFEGGGSPLDGLTSFQAPGESQ